MVRAPSETHPIEATPSAKICSPRIPESSSSSALKLILRGSECFLFYFVFIPALALCWAWKIVVWALLRVIYGESVQLMSAADAVCAHEPSGSRKEALIHALFRVEGKVEVEDFRERIRNNLVEARTSKGLLRHRRLRQRIEKRFGFYCWANVSSANFDYRWHIDSLRSPVDKITPFRYKGRSDMLQAIGRVMNEPMFPPGIAPWRILLLEQDDGSETLILLRSHHSLFDAGAAFLVMLPGLADNVTNVSCTFGNVRLTERDKLAARLLLWKNRLIGLLYIPRLWNRQLAISDDNWYKQSCHENDSVDGKRTTWLEDGLPVEKVLTVRKSTGVKFSTVVMSCISRALEEFARRQAEKSGGNSVGCLSATAFQAVSVWTPFSKPDLGNHITGASTPLILGIDDCPFSTPEATDEISQTWSQARLAQLLETDKVQKEWMRPELVWGSQLWTQLACNALLPWVMELHAVQRVLSGLTLFVSCLQGPRDHFAISGGKVAEVQGLMPLPPNVCVGFVLMTYGNKICVSLTGRKSVFRNQEDLELLLKLFEEDLDRLYKLILVKNEKKLV